MLTGNNRFAYLDPTGEKLLRCARDAITEAGISSANLFALGPGETAILTWTGTRVQQTIRTMLSCAGVESKDEGIALVLPLAASDVKHALQSCMAMAHDPLRLAGNIHPRWRRKYDQLLNDDLLDISISRNFIDLPVHCRSSTKSAHLRQILIDLAIRRKLLSNRK